MDAQMPPQGSAATAASSPPGRRFSVTITPRSVWLGAALVVAILVGGIIVSKALSTLVLLLLAIILAEAIRPLVVSLKRRRIPGPVAVLLIYVVALAIFGLLLWLLLTPLINEVSTFSNNLPTYLENLRHTVTELQQQLHAQPGLSNAVNSISNGLAAALQQLVPALLAVPFGVLSGIFGLFIDTVVVLTMTLFWLMATEHLKPFVVGLFPPAEREHAASVMSEIGRSFGGYVRGTLIAMALIGGLTAVGLSILGVPYALLLGVLAALTELLPYLGPWISGTVAVIVALIAVDPLKALEVAILFIIIQEIEGNVVEPLVMSRQVNLDPLLVIVAVLIGINLLGIVGAILAVPLAAGVQVLVVRVLAPAIRRQYGQTGQTAGAQPAVEATAPTAPAKLPSPS